MDLKAAAKRVVSFLLSDTLGMALMFVVAGYSIHAIFTAVSVQGSLLNAGIALVCLLLARNDMRRRDQKREALFVQKLMDESECQGGECCQDGHCEVDENECGDDCGCSTEPHDEACPDTEAKPENKVC